MPLMSPAAPRTRPTTISQRTNDESQLLLDISFCHCCSDCSRWWFYHTLRWPHWFNAEEEWFYSIEENRQFTSCSSLMLIYFINSSTVNSIYTTRVSLLYLTVRCNLACYSNSDLMRMMKFDVWFNGFLVRSHELCIWKEREWESEKSRANCDIRTLCERNISKLSKRRGLKSGSYFRTQFGTLNSRNKYLCNGNPSKCYCKWNDDSSSTQTTRFERNSVDEWMNERCLCSIGLLCWSLLNVVTLWFCDLLRWTHRDEKNRVRHPVHVLRLSITRITWIAASWTNFLVLF